MRAIVKGRTASRSMQAHVDGEFHGNGASTWFFSRAGRHEIMQDTRPDRRPITLSANGTLNSIARCFLQSWAIHRRATSACGLRAGDPAPRFVHHRVHANATIVASAPFWHGLATVGDRGEQFAGGQANVHAVSIASSRLFRVLSSEFRMSRHATPASCREFVLRPVTL